MAYYEALVLKGLFETIQGVLSSKKCCLNALNVERLM